MFSNEKLYEVMTKMDERLDQVQMDIAVIKEKQSQEIVQVKTDLARIEADQQDIRNEVKQVQEKISSRDRTLVGTFLTAGIGLFIWFIQESISK